MSQTFKSLSDELENFLGALPKEAERQSSEQIQEDDTKEDQDSLGDEQAEDSKDSGSNVEKGRGKDKNKNKSRDEVGDTPESNKGTKQMDSDDKAEDNSRIGKVKKEDNNNNNSDAEKEEKGMKEKQAEMARLGEGLIDLLEKTSQETQGNAPAGNQKIAEEDVPEGVSKEAFERMVKTANDKAGNYFSDYLSGMVKRAQDRNFVEQNLDKTTLKKYGGADAILDKLAQENPEAVLPPEVVEEEGEAPAEGDSGAPAESAEVEQEAPAESPEQGGEEQELDAIAEAMAAMGVTPEILEQAMQLIEDLKGQGYEEDQIAEAAAEMLEEQAAGAEAPMEEGAPEGGQAPAEAPAPEEPAEEEKEAVQKLKQKVASLKQNPTQGSRQRNLKQAIRKQLEG